MEVIKIDVNLNQPIISNPVVFTIGDFDGIHLAHQELFLKTIQLAKDKKYKSGVITFEPHPNSVIQKNDNNSVILALEDKLTMISQFMFDYLIIIHFDEDFMHLSHQDFVRKILKNLNTKEVVVGFDFRYGAFGIGNCQTLFLDSAKEIGVNVIEEKLYNNQKIGSTFIKELIQKGDFVTVKYLLGHNYFISGKVIHGRNVGGKIGVPTANLELLTNYPPLKEGVYAILCYIDNQRYLGICNIGHNPSFNFYDHLSYEIHIIDDAFKMDLYDKIIRVEFIKYLRKEECFISIEHFKKQIEKDKKEAIEVLNNAL